ncbi:hypothetical protein ACFV4P_14330 [Kitasatospora sp. NPDC059795]|uniref:hypothetical protein n=1 Tax=Kitasatospora sp. NPDC059795 TaxID=3346949 RepID=UPI003646E66E
MAALKDWFDSLTPLEQDFVLRQLCVPNPVPMLHLARDHSVTVAVVRDVRNQLHRGLHDAILHDRAALSSVTAVDEELLDPIDCEELIDRHDWLGAPVSDYYDLTVLHVLLGLRWHDARNGRWLFDGDIKSCISDTLDALDLDPFQIMSFEAARRCLSQVTATLPQHDLQLEHWLVRCGFEVQQTPGGRIVRTGAPDTDPAEACGETVGEGTHERLLYYVPSVQDLLSRLASHLHSEYEEAEQITLGELLADADDTEGELGLLARSIRDAVAVVPASWTLGTGTRRSAESSCTPESADAPGVTSTAIATAPAEPDPGRVRWLNSLREDVLDVLLEARVPLTTPEIAGRLERRIRYRTLRDLLAKDDEVIAVENDKWTPVLLPPEQSRPKQEKQTQLNTVAAVLAAEGRPLSTAELKERTEMVIQLPYLKQKLDADPRFQRAAKDQWALSEWGMPVYKPMKELVADLVDQHDGAVEADEVVRLLVRDFGVKESSLRQVMSTPPFSVRDGQVRRLADIRKEQVGGPGPDDHDYQDVPTVDDLIEDMGLI